MLDCNLTISFSTFVFSSVVGTKVVSVEAKE